MAHQHMTVISARNQSVGHSLRSTPTKGLGLTALSLRWWSPIQGLTEVNMPKVR